MKWQKLLDDQRKAKKALIVKTLKQAGTQAGAARLLGVSRQQMYTLCKTYEVESDK